MASRHASIQGPFAGLSVTAATAPVTPSDWPEPGPIDLRVHDLPHASSSLEWWYVNCHLETRDGEIGVFAAFFRQAAGRDPVSGEVRHTHSVAWAVSLPGQCRYTSKVAADELAPAVGLANLDAGAKCDDPRVERALREVLAKGHLPGPTRMFKTRASVATAELRLAFDGDRFAKVSAGVYELELLDERLGTGCKLRFELEKPAVRYGEDGVVHGVSRELMFYYFVPRARVGGHVTLDGEELEIIRGSGWYDHEFGFIPEREPAQSDTLPVIERGETTWRWLSIQLSDGSDVSVFSITRRATGEVLDNWAIVSDADGHGRSYRNARLETLHTWRSTRTFVQYPIRFRLRVPGAQLDLEVSATFPDQEVITVISEPAFWEGTVSVHGRRGGAPVLGKGWLECKGYGHADLGAFYAAVGLEVRSRLALTLPIQPDRAALQTFLVRGSTSARVTMSDALDGERLGRCLIQPIREIADRGGKGWRSYAALACIDVVGGDSRQFLHWLVMPEILHVGSLIVDDVEDASVLRRGGPTCHLIHGTPLAINAGTAAYFLAEPPLDRDDLAADTKLRIYRLYFDALRAGHAGQALDLTDVTDLAETAAATGDARALESHVLAVHRLKAGVPAGMFARAGALLGGGSEAQVERLGVFFEAVGLAFQIIDDVLCVRGFDKDLKQRGEDIRNGKLTLPVVKAIALLPRARRTWMWKTLATKPRDTETIELIGRELASCGALDACSSLAHQLVEDAWAELDPVLEDSQSKLMFRAFSWYVLERHY